MADKSKSTAQNSGSQNATDGNLTEGEDSDEPSPSSAFVQNNHVEDMLSSFREQWQRELVIQPHPGQKHLKKKDNKSLHDTTESEESQAKGLFLKGVEQEQAGNMFEAIQFYKKAAQLVPDIEFKLYESAKLKAKTNEKIDPTHTEGIQEELQETKECEYDEVNDADLEGLDFMSRLERIVSRSHCLCFPHFYSQATHISALPMEIVLYILRWVVSSDLDLRSCEMFGSSCRGFYLCSRDSEIWRLACARVWGLNCGILQNSGYKSWRQMFVERPHLRYNGCYISKTTYVRHGENSFQDQFYRPWHLVEYYRYLRFFPDGLVLMLTTPDEPAQCVAQLRHRTPKNPNVLVGHYRLRDRCVTLLVQRQEHTPKMFSMGHRMRRRRESIVETATQTFQLDLQIQNLRKKAHAQLVFLEYTVFTKNRNGTESESNFELAGARYPPLWFSRVKSYTAESETPLQ